MQRRYVRRRGFRTRRRAKFYWVRSTENIATPTLPTAVQIYDLLSAWRTMFGINLNLPDLVVWRIHIKISIHFTLTGGGFAANDSCLVAIYVDNVTQTAFFDNPVTKAYSQQYLMWDNLYASEQVMAAGNIAANFGANYKEYDIRSRRKLGNLDKTLYVVLAPEGNYEIQNSSITQSTLLRVPG